MLPWHAMPLDEVVRRLETEPTRGLSAAEAARRRLRHGLNALADIQGRPAWAIFVGQLKNLLLGLLLAAASVAFALGERVEGAAILAVIVLNAAIGFFTEWQAVQALTALRKQAVPTAHALREGAEVRIPAIELVPGDIVVLEAGSRVPADGRVLAAVQLQTDEASLTGESQAIVKTPEPVDAADAPLGDRVSMVFMGTSVTDGRGRMVVTDTGMTTEVGRIGSLVESVGAHRTPLEQKLSQLGRTLLWIVLALCAVIVLAGWLRRHPLLHMLEVGISLAIAAVPEGLPTVVTMTLALGMQRMAKRHALIRRLPAVETLGSTTVICSDKTGTLTRNEMTARVYRLGERTVEVTGTGYLREGEFRERGRRLDASADEHLALALRIGVLCGDASMDRSAAAAVVLGDPTEAALLVAAEKAGLRDDDLERRLPRVREIPFSSETRRMITVHRGPDGRCIAYMKGAPSAVLEASCNHYTPEGPRPLGPEDRERLFAANRGLAVLALRVLALAFKDVACDADEEELTRDFVFVGLVGMLDPLREEAMPAIARCRQAGIRTIMLTGDQEATATEIARQLGLDRDLRGEPLRTVHGRELARLDEAGWQRVVAEAGVFARVSPEHKLRIVEALQARGEVVAVTGDGINDAPALKQADIGVAMGIKGTEVAKEASDMIVTDDNFASIVTAVEQGRILYANILRFIHYLLSCNFAEILVVFVAILIGWPLPLAALQVLWLNLITDVFPALALALEPSSPEAILRPPHDPRAPLLSRRFLGLVAWQGALLAATTLLGFWIAMRWYGGEGEGLRHAVSVTFMTLALAQVLHAFNVRSRRRSTFDRRLFTNAWLWLAVVTCVALQLAAVYWRPLQVVLHTVPLAGVDWALVLGCSLAPVATVELVKLTARGAARRAPAASLTARTRS